MKLAGIINQVNLIAAKMLNPIASLFDLGIRLYIAKIFFFSGLTKIQTWETTKMLFEYEYEVPILSPFLAALSGTAVELIFPVLLVVGLFSRYSAAVLFILNYVAVIAYADISVAGVKDHMLWGALLLVTFFHGPGKLSLDYLLGRANNHKTTDTSAATNV